MAQIRLSQPTPREIDAREVGSLELCRIELAAAKIGTRDLDAAKVCTVEGNTGSDQDRDGVGGGGGGTGIGLGLLDGIAELLLERGILTNAFGQELQDRLLLDNVHPRQAGHEVRTWFALVNSIIIIISIMIKRVVDSPGVKILK
jgi:hypothetical protein